MNLLLFLLSVSLGCNIVLAYPSCYENHIEYAPTGTDPVNGTCTDPTEFLGSCAELELDCDKFYQIRRLPNGKPQIIERAISVIAPCYMNKCSCKSGYKRKHGVCIPESECPWIEVKQGEEWPCY